MKKAPALIILVLVFLHFVSSDAGSAGTYKITASITEMGQVCYITGMVVDGEGKGVHPAEVTFAGCSVNTTVQTLEGGYFMHNPPPCSDYRITARTPEGSSVVQKASVESDEILPIDLTISGMSLLKEALCLLGFLTGSQCVEAPRDFTEDGRIGVDDAVRALQMAARETGINPEGFISRGLPASVNQARVEVARDSNGDGVYDEDWSQNASIDAFGNLEVGGLPNGLYTVTVYSPDEQTAVRVPHLKIAGRTVNLKGVRLRPLGSISGNVRLEGAEDHSDVRIMIPGTSLAAVSDVNGDFTISSVPEGSYDVKFTKASFGTTIKRDVPVSPDTRNSAGRLSLSSVGRRALETAVGRVTLTSVAGSLEGTVRLASTEDHSGSLLTLKSGAGASFAATTRTDGTYEFADIPVGEYSFSIVPRTGLHLSRFSFVNLTQGTNSLDPVTLPLLGPEDVGTLIGSIVEHETGDAVGYVVVSVSGTRFLCVADAWGKFELTGLPKGVYTVFMDKEGFRAHKKENVQITGGGVTWLDTVISLQRIEEGASNSGSIMGTASYLDKDAHAGIAVKIEGSDIPLAGTDTNGAFLMNNVPPGTYKLTFTQANYTTVTRTGVIVPPWNAVELKPVTMVPPVGEISGKVFLEGESSHHNVTIALDGTDIDAQTTSEGLFVLTSVPAGTYTLTAYRHGFQRVETQDVQVTAGRRTILQETIELNTPPEPPTGLVASQASGSSATVSWTASVSDDVAGYNVYFGTESSAITTLANDDPIPSTVPEYEVTGLRKGVTYYFAVKARDDEGLDSVISQYVQAEIIPRQPVPPNPAEILERAYPFAYPEEICISRDGTRAYVTNRWNNLVSLINLEDESVTVTIPVGREPSDVAADPQKDQVYCVNSGSHNVSIIDTTEIDPAAAVIGSLETAPHPHRAHVSPDGKYLFVSCGEAGGYCVTVIDLDTRAEIPESPMTVGDDPAGMTIANGKLYVASKWGNNLSVIDIAEGSPTRWQRKPYNIPVGSSPLDVGARPDGAFVYVTNNGDDTVSVIDTAIDQVVSTLTVGEKPYGLVASGYMLYVTNHNSGTFSMINTDTNQLLGASVTVGSLPRGIAVSSDGERIYVVNHGTESVSIRTY